MPLSRDVPTYILLLESCYAAKNLQKLQQLHAQLIKLRLSPHDFIRVKLVSAYSSCGEMDDAQYMFSLCNRQSTFLFNTLIRGYSSIKEFHHSVSTFRQMLFAHKQIDSNTLPAVLKSISGLSALYLGRHVHAFALVNGFGLDKAHCNSLITMYAKCGELGYSRKVFDNMPERNTISWCAMMGGYGMHGQFLKVFELFDRMMGLGVWPDEATFTTVLMACSHGGRVEEGREYFKMMKEKYKMKPSMEHYTCMIDLLGRAGQIDEAKEIIERMEIEPDQALWRALLWACKIHGKTEIAVRGRNLTVRNWLFIGAGYFAA